MIPTDVPLDVVAFVDANHVHWQVCERDAHADPGARGARCLVFAARETVRRVWSYPAFWRDLGAEALIALSWRR